MYRPVQSHHATKTAFYSPFAIAIYKEPSNVPHALQWTRSLFAVLIMQYFVILVIFFQPERK